MSNALFVEPIIETIGLLLDQAANNDEQTKVLLILQTSPFFEELASDNSLSNDSLNLVLAKLRLFFKLAKDNIKLFIESEENSAKLVSLFLKLMDSPLKSQIGQEVASFVSVYLYENYPEFPSYSHYIKFLTKFFHIPEYAAPFEQQGGLYSIWDVFKHVDKFEKSPFAKHYEHLYLQSTEPIDGNDFLSFVIGSFEEFDENAFPNAFQFLIYVFMHQKCDLIGEFTSLEGFDKFNKYVLTHNQSSLLILYQFFRPLAKLGDRQKIPYAMQGIIQLIVSEELKPESRADALRFLYSFIQDFTAENYPLTSNEIFSISDKCKTADEISILTEIIFLTGTKMGYDVVEILPALLKRMTPQILVDSKTNSIFKIIKYLWSTVALYGPPFIMNLIKECTNEQFYTILNKYHELYSVASLCIGSECKIEDKKQIIAALINAGPYITEATEYKAVIADALFTDSLRTSVIDETLKIKDQKELLKMIYSAVIRAAGKPFIRNKFIEQNILKTVTQIYNAGGLEVDLIFDLIIALSGHTFNQTLDQQVTFLVAHTDFVTRYDNVFFEKLAFDSGNSLIFPSLLALCKNIDLKTPYDIWVCAQFGLSTWLVETKKSIFEFPAINKLCERYITPVHAKELLTQPQLIIDSIQDNFGSIPLFQFQKKLQNTQLAIKFGHTQMQGMSISFWFNLTELPQQQQVISQFMGSTLSCKNDKLSFENTEIAQISPDVWYNMILVISERSKMTIYLNTKQICTCSIVFDSNIVFSSSINHILWYVGGCVRIITRMIQEGEIRSIFELGVANVTKYLNKEKLAISTAAYLKPFGVRNSHFNHIGENVLLVPSYPLIYHLLYNRGGNNTIFKLIMESISQNDESKAKKYIEELIAMQKYRKSSWNLEQFASHISILLNIVPQYFDDKLISLLLSPFVISDENIDWNSLLIIILDPGLFNSPNANQIISILLGYVVQNPPPNDNQQNDQMFLFCFVALQLIEMSEETKQELLAFMSKLTPDVEFLVMCFVSMTDFKDQIQNPHLGFSMPCKSPFYNEMLGKLMSRVTPENCWAFLFRIVNPDDALNALNNYVMDAIKANSQIDKHFIMRYCIEFCYVKPAWTIAYALIGQKNQSNSLKDKLIRRATIDFSILPDFLIMVSVLSGALSAKDIPLWNDEIVMISNVLKEVITTFQVAYIDNNLIFALASLMNDIHLADTMCCFPFDPSEWDADAVFKKATTKGLPFNSKGEASSCPAPIFNALFVDDEIVSQVWKTTQLLIPKTVNFLPPHSDVTINSSVFSFNVAQTLHHNNKQLYTSWCEFVRAIRKKITSENETPVEQTPFSKFITQFIAQVFVVSVIDDNLFTKLLEDLLLTHVHVSPKHALTVTQDYIMHIFNTFTAKKIYSQLLINFTCDRIMEGWFSTVSPQIFSGLLTYLDKVKHKTVPIQMIEAIVFMLDVVPDRQLRKLADLINHYQQTIFPSHKHFDYIQNIEVAASAIAKLGRSNESSAKSLAISLFSKMIEDDDFTAFWLSHAEQDVNETKKLMMDQNSFDAFKTYDQKFDERIKQRLLTSLQNLATKRAKNSSTFYEYADNFSRHIHADVIASRSIACLLSVFVRDLFVFHCEYFLRSREQILTKQKLFNITSRPTKTLSLLSDPLYPTRRLEPSPAIYNFPVYPNGVVTEAYPQTPDIDEKLTHWPKQIRDIISVPYQFISHLSLHDYQGTHLLTFSCCELPIPGIQRLGIVQALFNGGGSFSLQSPIDFLYGVEPISGLLLKGRSSFYFMFGISEDSNSLCAVREELYPLLLRFYLSYMIAGSFGTCTLFAGRPVISWQFNEIMGFQKHLWLQKPYGLEIATVRGWNFIFVANKSNIKQVTQSIQSVVNETFSQLPPKSHVRSPVTSLRMIKAGLSDATKAWEDGKISNFTYLLLLNKFGLRSYCDYSQYFIMPWIISDYNSQELSDEARRDLTKPMGQLGEGRLAKFEQIYQDSGDNYFYGTHYMHFGVVLYYMFRIDPFCMFSVYLHHGWDHPNRIFYDIKESWNSAALVSPADVKEMIPQIISVPEVYMNTSKLPLLPAKQEVALGGWAKNPRHFVSELMNSLEDEKTSAQLNSWIDLIFGRTSRGDAAVQAKNVFHPLCYPNLKDDEIAEIEDDDVEREAVKTCILNFGQCPPLLFKRKHSTRNEAKRFTHIMTEPSFLVIQRVGGQRRTPFTDVVLKRTKVMSCDGTALLVRPKCEHSIAVSAIAHTIVAISHDSSRRVTEIIKSGDVIAEDHMIRYPSSTAISPDGLFLAIGQHGGSVLVYRLMYNGKKPIAAEREYYMETIDSVRSIFISTEHFLLLSTAKFELEAFSLGTGRKAWGYSPGFEISSVCIDDETAEVIVGGAELAVLSISGDELMRKSVSKSVTCVRPCGLPETAAKRFFVAGHVDGTVSFWKIDYAQMSLKEIAHTRCCKDVIVHISVNKNAQRIAAASFNEIFDLSYRCSPIKPIDKEQAMECCICHNENSSKLKACTICHRYVCDGCSKEEVEIQQGFKKLICDECAALLKIDKKK